MTTLASRGSVPACVSERWLIRSAQRGDQRAQAELLCRYEPLLRRLVRPYFLPGADREDLVQEARVGFLKAMRSWEAARDIPFSAYVIRCASNHIKNALECAAARKHQPLNSARAIAYSAAEPGIEIVDSLADPEQTVLRRDQVRTLLTALPALTVKERQAVVGALIGVPHKQLAYATGSTAKGVTTSLRRARAKLAPQVLPDAA